MQIYEEYFKRHLMKVPLVKHTSLGFLFLRELSETVSWKILYTYWSKSEGHPGTYTIRQLIPVRNSRTVKTDSCRYYSYDCLNSWKFEEAWRKQLFWDEYESFFLDWSSSVVKKSVIQGRKSVILTAWEMFVYANDTYFSRSFRDHASLVFATLNFNSTVDERYRNYLKFMHVVDKKIDPFYSWQSDLNQLTYNYSTWIPELVAKNGR